MSLNVMGTKFSNFTTSVFSVPWGSAMQEVVTSVCEVLGVLLSSDCILCWKYRIALYFQGPKLSRLDHAEQFHKIIFTISGMALTS